MSKRKHKKNTIQFNTSSAPSLAKDTPSDPTALNLMKYKFWYLGFSLVLLLPCIISLVFFGLRTSIDFTGGSVFRFTRTQGEWDKTQIQTIYYDKGIETAQILFEDEGRTAVIKTKPVSADKNEEITAAMGDGIAQVSFETVGSSIGAETARKSLFAFGLSCLGIVLYIAYVFRNVPKPFSGMRFGVSAILAMVHDALIVTGVFSILGQFLGVEVDPMFITALLTVIGFSVHDTIVVFDRVRENLGKFKNKDIDWVANFSVLETMRRSITTSATVVITLTALYVFGGSSIRYFVLALLVGVVSGTYSSIFNATPILIIWEGLLNKKNK